MGVIKIQIFVSKTSNTLNGKIYDIENILPFLCFNPLYRSVNTSCHCISIMDSGAYQDENDRVTFEESLKRQNDLQEKLGYLSKYIVAYDKIGDSEVTMEANQFLLLRDLNKYQEKILVCQGSTTSEYSDCLSDLLSMSKSDRFVLGFGGIANAGRDKKIANKIYDAVAKNLSEFSDINHIHLFGCFTDRIIKFFEHTFPKKYITVDTAGFEIKSAMGYCFENGKYYKRYSKAEKFIDYHPNVLVKENIRSALSYYNCGDYYRYMNSAMM